MSEVKVVVGAITRRRLDGLQKLFESYAAMKRPEGASLMFMLCENDDSTQIEEVVADFREAVSEPVHVMLEPRKGIPLARNRVLAAALEAGADYLTFVDDDEVVTEDWLVDLLQAAQQRELDLAGGPWPSTGLMRH